MTAVVIGLLSVSIGAAYSVSFGGVLIGDVLMGFGLFAGIKGLCCLLFDTLRAEDPRDGFVAAPVHGRQMSRHAVRAVGHLRPMPPHAASLRRYGAMR